MMALSFVMACHKSDTPAPSGQQQTSGKLIYQNPAVDGAGLFYKVETTDEILIPNPDATEDPLVKYAAFLDVHTNLSYKDTGRKGCLGNIAGCTGTYRIIDIISMKKE